MKYLFPPRPKSKTTPIDLPIYEKMGQWVIQRKFNGTRNLICIDLNGVIKFYNRYGKPHARYQPSKNIIKSIQNLNLDQGKDYILDGELMNKQKGNPEIVVLYDVLMCGRYLFSHPDQQKRLDILNQICRNPKEKSNLGYVISEQLMLAENWKENFVEHFNESLPDPMIEGLVLRKKSVGLDNFGQSEYETNSLIRCRKAIDTGYNF